jgi:N-acetylglucosaminyldiphosphoundecaprenol N-acetyl-beta-D-mannosaminyltransferase
VSPPDNGYAEFDGVRIGRLSLDDAKEAIRSATIGPSIDEPFQIATVNVDFLALARRDDTFRLALQCASMAVADGMPIVWLARHTKSPLPERVTGVDLATWLLDGGLPSAKIFLLGSTAGVLKEARARARVHRAHVVGVTAPARSELTSSEWSAQLVKRINASGANVLLVALGAPLQETWIAEWRSELHVAVAIGVGCSLDVAVGKLTRAPERWQRLGLEWLYRLTTEPTRLWRRYVLRDVPFLIGLALRTLLAETRATAARAET